jgi:large subunit ribosomal protein L9
VRVVLRSDVDGVGRRGDIVEVSGGFARNYLLPEGRAIVATEGVTSQAAAMRKARDQREAQDRETAENQAKALSGGTVVVRARAGSGGRLFGSVGPADIVAAIVEQKGIEVDRRHVALDEPIKSVGSREVALELFGGVTALVNVEVAAAE